MAASRYTLQQNTARVTGVVLDQSGAPISGAQVSLSAGSTVIAQTKTDAEGRFIFDALPSNVAVTLTVRAEGFVITDQSMSVAQIASGQIEITLALAPLSEQVSVTATRVEARLDNTAASVVVISSKELETTAALTLDDALRQVPGFQLFRRSSSRNANPTTQGVSLRGVGASGASRALVLADGIPLNDPFGGWIYWNRVPRESVNRLEVLRGGASALYGSAALGGVVQIITRTPTRAPTLSFETSYGNEETPDASLFISGSKKLWSASLAAQTFRTDGYIPVDKQARGRVDTPAGSRYAALDLKLERELYKTGRVFVRGAVFGESRTNGTLLQTNRTHLRQLSAGGDWQAKNFGALNLRAYGGTEVFDQNFSAVASDRNSETLTRVQRVPSQFFGVTSQWSRSFGERHTVVAGFDGREVRGASDEIVLAQNRPSSLIGAGGRELTLGAFAEDIFRLTSRLIVTGGARFDRWRNYRAQLATRSLRQNSPAIVNAFADRTETAFSPQASALYKLSGRASIAASVYRAFRQPTLNELYRSFRVGDVLTQANENLRAERLTGGEAGINFAAFDGKLNVRGTFFLTETGRSVGNVTLNVTPNLITRQRQNLGRTRSRGIEIETESRLNDSWTITGGYLFVDARVARFPFNTALEGLLLPQVARHQATFQLRYAKPSLVSVGVQGRVGGRQFDDDQNRFQLGRFFTIDFLASRRIGKGLEIFGAAENLFDQRNEAGRTPITTLGSPRLMRLGLRLRLGT
ncbi:MAG: TonB-dependent receptor [Pyrinomonadaceae bacterium]